MKHYHTIRRQSPMELDHRVNQYLELGWVLIGGISTYKYNKERDMFCQAVAWQDDISQGNFKKSTPEYPSTEADE